MKALLCLGIICSCVCASPHVAAAADAPATRPAATTQPAQQDRAALEKAFAEKLTNVKLVGSFSARDDRPPRKDSYTILKAAKLNGDLWSITAKIEYKGFAVPIEMHLPVLWAGDTPVISITNHKIVGFGTFTARVMFYGDEYAGTWAGESGHGGQMWGKLEKITTPEAAGAKKANE